MLCLNVVNPDPRYHTGQGNYLSPTVLFFIGCSCWSELVSEHRSIYSLHYWKCICTILLPKISTALKNTLRDHLFTLLFRILVTTVFRQATVHESHLEKHNTKAPVHLLFEKKEKKRKKGTISLHPELFLGLLKFYIWIGRNKNRADFLNECDLA